MFYEKEKEEEEEEGGLNPDLVFQMVESRPSAC
jgi:hypothetical protein